jgi:protein-disulfide isomerase
MHKRKMRCSATVRPVLLTFLTVFAGMAEDRTAVTQNSPQESGITRQQADAMLELRAIRLLLESKTKPPAPPVPKTGKLKMDGGVSLGSSGALVTVVEFTDYQCPFCRQFQSRTFAEIRKKYVDTGKVRFVIP